MCFVISYLIYLCIVWLLCVVMLCTCNVQVRELHGRYQAPVSKWWLTESQLHCKHMKSQERCQQIVGCGNILTTQKWKHCTDWVSKSCHCHGSQDHARNAWMRESQERCLSIMAFLTILAPQKWHDRTRGVHNSWLAEPFPQCKHDRISTKGVSKWRFSEPYLQCKHKRIGREVLTNHAVPKTYLQYVEVRESHERCQQSMACKTTFAMQRRENRARGVNRSSFPESYLQNGRGGLTRDTSTNHGLTAMLATHEWEDQVRDVTKSRLPEWCS